MRGNRPVHRTGRAGASYALTVAARCGMPREVIERARTLLTSETREKPENAVAFPKPPRAEAARELVLVGARVEDALSRLDKFLDAALATGLDSVRIVHGYGTGALRDAVHRRLKESGFRDYRLGKDGDEPGGSDVTHLRLDR